MTSDRRRVVICHSGLDTKFGVVSALNGLFEDSDIRCFVNSEGSIDDALRNTRVCIIVLCSNFAKSAFCLDNVVAIMSAQTNPLVLPVFYGVEPSAIRHTSASSAHGSTKVESSSHAERERWVRALEKLSSSDAERNRWAEALQKLSNINGFRYRRETMHLWKLLKRIVGRVEDIFSENNSVKRTKDVFLCHRGPDTKLDVVSLVAGLLGRKNITYFVDYHMERGEHVWPAIQAAILNAIVHVIFFSRNFAGSQWCVREVLEIRNIHGPFCSSNMRNHKLLPVYYDVNAEDVWGQPENSAYNSSQLKRVSSFEKRSWAEFLPSLKALNALVYNIESSTLWDLASEIVAKVEDLLNEVQKSSTDSENSSSLTNYGHTSILCYCEHDSVHEKFINRLQNTFDMLGLDFCPRWKDKPVSKSLQIKDQAETLYVSNVPHCENGIIPTSFSSNLVEVSFEQPTSQLDKVVYKVNVEDKVEYKVMVDEVLRLLDKENKMINEVTYFPSDRLQRQDEIESCMIQYRTKSNISLQCFGLLGEEGVGKTTVAKFIYYRVRQQFDRSCFTPRVTRSLESKSLSLEALQEQILDDLTLGDWKGQKIKNVEEGRDILKDKLKGLNAFIVLNDMANLEHLWFLFLPLCDSLGPKSIVLITSCHPQVLQMAQSKEIFTIKRLDKQSSRRLFYQHAFMKLEPPRELKEVAEEVIDACEGRPFLLKITGADLYHNSDCNYWRKRGDLLRRNMKNISEKLKLSLEGLESEQENAFLDICCFFIGEKEEIACMALEGLNGKEGKPLNALKSRCLISTHGFGEDKRITMHDRLRDMGRHIIRETAKNRAWDEETMRDILEDERSIAKVRGLSLDVRVFCEAKISDCTKLDELRILEVKGDSPMLPHDSRNFLGKVCCGELRLLRWTGAPLQRLPHGLCSEKLRVLDLSQSNIKEMPASLPNLQILELQFCSELEKFAEPFHTSMPSLRHLNLFECTKLEGLDPSIEKLNNLMHLDIGLCGCIRFPEEVKIFHLHGRDSLTEISFLPKNIRTLNLSSCSNLKSMDDVSSLANLQELDISRCTNLTHLPAMRSLRKMDLNGCNALESLDSCFKDFSSLRELNLSNCTSLKTLSCLPSCLQKLNLRECTELETVSFDALKNLRILYITPSLLNRLPKEIKSLDSLSIVTSSPRL